MLTPMLVQYVVGLCCMRRNPDAVDVTVGDLVFDTAAQKERDVDVTITVQEPDGFLRAFKAYEVKREGEPLDVTVVEQLCMKLRDMPSVTHRAIVSASHFTTGAVAKASHHGVDLFVLKPWAGQSSSGFGTFEGREPQSPIFSGFDVDLLCWIDYTINVVTDGGPQSFRWERTTPVFGRDGNRHAVFPDMGTYTSGLLFRSTQILFEESGKKESIELSIVRARSSNGIQNTSAVPTSSAVPRTHTLQVRDDEAFLTFDDLLAQIVGVTISGKLQWQTHRRVPEFRILESVPSGEAFAGAAVSDWGTPDGKMLAIVFSPQSPSVGMHWFQLGEKHKNAIRKLKLIVPK